MKVNVQLSVFLASFAVVICRSQFPSNGATILQQSNNFNGMDPWRWNFKTSNGILREEEGSLLGDILEVRGSYSWTAPDGTKYVVIYQAGKEGYTAKTVKVGSEPFAYMIGSRPMFADSPPAQFAPAAPGSIGPQVDFKPSKLGEPQDLGVNAQLSLIG